MSSNEAEYRIEHDTMGEVQVPINALYRAQTQRAVENFPISGTTLERAHIAALAQIKKAAALAMSQPVPMRPVGHMALRFSTISSCEAYWPAMAL